MSARTQPKPFGLWTLTFLVIANMIGAGVFTTSGYTLQALGTPGRVVMAWIGGGLIAICGAWSYGQLVRARPESGGEYLFLSRLGHPLLGFIAGWVSLIAGFTGAIALAATALESYLLPDEIRPSWLPVDTVALAAIVLGGVCHGLQSRTGAVIQNAAVVLKLVLLAGFLGLAVFFLPSHTWHHQPLPNFTLGGWALVATFASQLVWISLSYSGFNAAVYVAGEARNPEQTVPRALLLGTCVVFVMYVLLNALFVYAPSADAIAGARDVAAIAARSLGGPTLAIFVRIIIALGLLTSVTSMMMAAPRVYAKMAEDGMLPKALQFRDAPPRAAVIVQVVLAAIMIRFSSLRNLIPYLGLTLSLSAACSVGCLFLPNVRRRPLWHWSHLPPACYVLCTIVTAGIMSYGQPTQFLATALTFYAGVRVYAMVNHPVASETTSRQLQFSLRGMLVLIAASACWLWLVAPLGIEGLAVLTGLTFAVAIVAIGVDALVPSRLTVLEVGLLLTPLTLALLTGAMDQPGVSILEAMFLLSYEPIETMLHLRDAKGFLELAPYCAASIIATLAHPLRPGKASAVITVMGISAWYAMSLLIMQNAG